MKRYIFLFALFALALVGCEDNNGVKFSDYPIAGKSYKHNVVDNYYDIYVFKTDGRCSADGYSEEKYIGSIDDYYWWMEGDSIFIDCGKDGYKRKYKYMRGAYFENYIVLNRDTMTIVY